MTKGGRPKDKVRERVTPVAGGKTPRWRCNDCGGVFAGSASRIKVHLKIVQGKGIRLCPGKEKSINGEVIMEKVGRRRDKVWERVTPLQGEKRWKCNDCGEEFAGGASRIKAHLNKLKGKGIRPCDDEFYKFCNSLGDIGDLDYSLGDIGDLESHDVDSRRDIADNSFFNENGEFIHFVE